MKNVSKEFKKAVASAFMGMYQQGCVTDAIVAQVLGDRVNELNSNEQYVLRVRLEEMLENTIHSYDIEDLEYLLGIQVANEEELDAFWENYEISEESVVSYLEGFDDEYEIWEDIFQDVKDTTASIQTHMIDEAKKALDRITAEATPYEQLSDFDRNVRDISNSLVMEW